MGTAPKRTALLQRRITDRNAIIVSITAASVSLLIFGISGGRMWLTFVATALASALLGSAVLLLWQVIVDRGRVQEILDVVGLDAEVRRAGLRRISSHLGDFDFESLLPKSREIDIWFTNNNTWVNRHARSLAAGLSKGGRVVRFLLPDPDDESCMAEIGRRFNVSSESIRSDIGALIERLFEIQAQYESAGCSFDVRVSGRAPMYAYYRCDGSICLRMFSSALPRGRHSRPVLVVERDGVIGRFVGEDFDHAWAHARLRCRQPSP